MTGSRRAVVGERPIHLACALVLLVLAEGQAAQLWPGPWEGWVMLALLGLTAGAGATLAWIGGRSPR